MTNVLKVGIVATLVGVVLYAASQSEKLVKEFAFRISGFGVPSISEWMLRVPIVVEFNNFIGLPIDLDKLSGVLSVRVGNQWVQVANFSQPVAIQPGTQKVTVDTNIDLKKFAAANLATVAFSIMQTRKVFVRAEISAQYGMLNIPSEPFEQELSV